MLASDAPFKQPTAKTAGNYNMRKLFMTFAVHLEELNVCSVKRM